MLIGFDRRVIEDVAMRRLLLETYADGLRDGAAGWIDDVSGFRKPWGIDWVTSSAPCFWHGQDDEFLTRVAPAGP